jgi:hypothetical protein
MQRFALGPVWPFVSAATVVLVMSACGKTSHTEPAASAVSTSHDTADAHASEALEPSEVEAPVAGAEGDPDDIQVAPMAVAAGVGSAALLAEATRVLDTMTASTYSHKTHVEGTVYDLDCSGFVDYVLARVAPAALGELRAATVKRPLAKHFVDFLAAPAAGAARTPWERITRVEELTPGSLVAWRKPADVTSTNTGHVMIVAAPPTQREDGGWLVAVLDSSASPHGKDDTRKKHHATGVGRGTMVLETNARGAPVAYRWSPLHVSHRHATEIVMGRPR